jgi:hypothetical protein
VGVWKSGILQNHIGACDLIGPKAKRPPDGFRLTIAVSEMSIETTETVVTDNQSLIREWSTLATAAV